MSYLIHIVVVRVAFLHENLQKRSKNIPNTISKAEKGQKQEQTKAEKNATHIKKFQGHFINLLLCLTKAQPKRKDKKRNRQE
jgi:hypothetical protein